MEKILENKSAVVRLDPEQLLLPESVKMVRCYPANIAVTVESVKPKSVQA